MENVMNQLVEAADEVHNILGSGCSESTYHRAYERELSERGIGFSSEGTIPILYKGVPVGKRRPDMFVHSINGVIAVELKAGSGRGEGQLFNYLSILESDNNFNITGGILIQFNDNVEITLTQGPKDL